MSSAQTAMEIREDDIRAHYEAAYQLLAGFEVDRIRLDQIKGSSTAGDRWKELQDDLGIDISEVDDADIRAPEGAGKPGVVCHDRDRATRTNLLGRAVGSAQHREQQDRHAA